MPRNVFIYGHFLTLLPYESYDTIEKQELQLPRPYLAFLSIVTTAIQLCPSIIISAEQEMEQLLYHTW